MDGLEVTEIKLSGVQQASEAFRVESEYFKKNYLEIVAKLDRLPGRKFEHVVSEIIHPVEIQRVYEDDGIQIMLAQNVRNNFFDFSNEVFMPSSARAELATNIILEDDVIMTRSGANFGQTSCYKYRAEIFACADVLILRPHDAKGGYVSTFLNSFYGRQLLNRGSYGMAQPHIAPPYLWTLRLPSFRKLEGVIDDLVLNSIARSETSKALFTDAENILLDELGLGDWQPLIESKAVKSFRESFAQTGRLDAEYYQPKYDELKAIVKANAVSLTNVESMATFNQRGDQPDYVEDGELRIINSRHILEQHLDYDNFERTSASSWENFPLARVSKNDILIYTTGANVGRTNIYLIDEPALASNHVNILRIDGVDPVYVAFVLNSLVGRMQTKQIVTGSAKAELYPDAIAQFIVPFISEENQKMIGRNVNESFVKTQESKRLLETAKRAVEIAIEQNETAALDYIGHNRL